MLLSKTQAARVLILSPIFTKTRFILYSAHFSSLNSFLPPASTPTIGQLIQFDSKSISSSFKDWFKSRDTALLDQIFEILASTTEDFDLELKLTQLGLKLNQEFVLKVLNHGDDVLSCLRFFDWAGRQRGYVHSRATFYAIFKILSREKLMSLMLDFLESYKAQRQFHKVRFHDTLVVGYAVAGKPDVALRLFGMMRFQGIDLDPFAYHVFLNALVEQSCYDVVEVVFQQILLRGFENEITWCIRVKNFCKQSKLDEAVSFLRELKVSGYVISDRMMAVLVDAHCKGNKFEEAHKLMEDFWVEAKVPLEKTYAIWTRELVRAGKLDGALDFLRSKKSQGYLPDVFRYNLLICKLLRENRLNDVSDLLKEMMEGEISPDKVTMNAALCFFCKAGMVDVALDFYNSRSEFGLSPNNFSYNFLINTLCGDGSVDEAYMVLKDSIKHDYFPRKSVSIIADVLCREGKLDKMKELVLISLEQKVMPSDDVCVKFISALCKARRVEEGYLIFGEFNGMGKVNNRYTYFDLVRGFNKANRGDMAARLLIEMQENGHKPTRSLYRAVICCICTMDRPENQFFKLLEMQLSRAEPSCEIYNYFIDGAGHAIRPDLARKVFEMMTRNGIEPTNASKLFMLQSYLKSERISDALNFYDALCKKGTPGRKLNNTMVVGLSRAKKPGYALDVLRQLREKQLLPSLESYEELVKSFCSTKNYDMVLEVIDDLLKSGRKVSSFIGNVLLLHSLKSRELYQAWVRSGKLTKEASPSGSLTLGQLVGLFSGSFRVNPNVEDLDEIIEQCFPLDTYTYNMLLRRISMTNRLDRFIELFYKMRDRGHQHNKWTYDIIIHVLCRHGRRNEAMKWVNEAHRMGFELTDRTKQLL